jgi:hypothetical protein
MIVHLLSRSVDEGKNPPKCISEYRRLPKNIRLTKQSIWEEKAVKTYLQDFKNVLNY